MTMFRGWGGPEGHKPSPRYIVQRSLLNLQTQRPLAVGMWVYMWLVAEEGTGASPGQRLVARVWQGDLEEVKCDLRGSNSTGLSAVEQGGFQAWEVGAERVLSAARNWGDPLSHVLHLPLQATSNHQLISIDASRRGTPVAQTPARSGLMLLPPLYPPPAPKPGNKFY